EGHCTMPSLRGAQSATRQSPSVEGQDGRRLLRGARPWAARRADPGARNDNALNRPLALDRHPVHHAALAVIIVDRVVLDGAVVPERDRALLPPEAAGEFRAHRVAVEVVEERRALLLGHVLEARGEATMHVERLPAAFDMGAHHRVVDLAMRVL